MSDDPPRNMLARLGTVLLFAGAGFVFFLMVSRSPSSTIPLPRFLHVNRDLWLVVGGMFVAAGMFCLKRSSAPAESHPDSPFERVVLYTRSECHLCDDAKAILNRHRARLPGIEEVDIDGDSDLVAEFGDWVPVVEIDGKVRFKGKISEILLVRLMDGTENQPSVGDDGSTDA